ncbi:hypothetical protein HA38_05085 [Pantoea allii]|nr:hypothetical protein HA38_05085 [Pantoea allii]
MRHREPGQRIVNSLILGRTEGKTKRAVIAQQQGGRKRLWRGALLKVNQIFHGVMTIAAAHLNRWLKSRAHVWPQGRCKNFAEVIIRELNAARISGFTLRHARNGRGNAGGDTTGTAICTTFHLSHPG